MEWVANAVAMAFAVAGFAAWWRWMRSEMARGDALETAGAKKMLVWTFAALLLLVPIAAVPMFIVDERDFMLGVGIGFGILLGGIAPVAVFMYLATTQFVRSEDREPVVLSPESRRQLRVPIAGSIAGAFVVGTATIWLVGRSADPTWVLVGALAVTVGLTIWPMLAINACANRERAAKATAPSPMR
jgi:uncharacterized membrane protein